LESLQKIGFLPNHIYKQRRRRRRRRRKWRPVDGILVYFCFLDTIEEGPKANLERSSEWMSELSAKLW
jgi:hypothetical protein